MNKSQIILLALLGVATTPVFAHMGDHNGLSAAQLLLHLMTQHHLLVTLVVVPLLATTGVTAWLLRRKAKASS